MSVKVGKEVAIGFIVADEGLISLGILVISSMGRGLVGELKNSPVKIDLILQKILSLDIDCLATFETFFIAANLRTPLLN